jgi:ankyrin repeat protein
MASPGALVSPLAPPEADGSPSSLSSSMSSSPPLSAATTAEAAPRRHRTSSLSSPAPAFYAATGCDLTAAFSVAAFANAADSEAVVTSKAETPEPRECAFLCGTSEADEPLVLLTGAAGCGHVACGSCAAAFLTAATGELAQRCSGRQLADAYLAARSAHARAKGNSGSAAPPVASLTKKSTSATGGVAAGAGAIAAAHAGKAERTVPPALLCQACLCEIGQREAYARDFWRALEVAGPAAFQPDMRSWVSQDAVAEVERRTAVAASAARLDATLVPAAPLPAACRAVVDRCAVLAALNIATVPRPPSMTLSTLAAPKPTQAFAPEQKLLACPNLSCDHVLVLEESDMAPAPAPGAAREPRHHACPACTAGLCGSCGSAWVVAPASTAGASAGQSHVGLSCEAHLVGVQRAAEEARLARDPMAVIAAVGNPASKVCPNPHCGRVFVRYRGHFCHSVTCDCGLAMCYNCLATSSEMDSHFCSTQTSYCSDICGCIECPVCATGTKCADCPGDCSACRRKRPETLEEAAESSARRAAAAARHLAAYPEWTGSRRARDPATLVLPEHIHPTRNATEAARRVALSAAEDAVRRAGAGMSMIAGPLAGAAASVREGLELIAEAYATSKRELKTCGAAWASGDAEAWRKEPMLRTARFPCGLREGLDLLLRQRGIAARGGLHAPEGAQLLTDSEAAPAEPERAAAVSVPCLASDGFPAALAQPAANGVEGAPGLRKVRLRDLVVPAGLMDADMAAADALHASTSALLHIAAASLIEACDDAQALAPADLDAARRNAVRIFRFIAETLLSPVEPFEPDRAAERGARRAAWVIELLSLDGINALVLALEHGGDGAVGAEVRAAATAVCEQLAEDDVSLAAAAGWAGLLELDEEDASAPTARAAQAPASVTGSEQRPSMRAAAIATAAALAAEGSRAAFSTAAAIEESHWMRLCACSKPLTTDDGPICECGYFEATRAAFRLLLSGNMAEASVPVSLDNSAAVAVAAMGRMTDAALVRSLLVRLAVLSQRHEGPLRPPSALLAAAWAGTLLPRRTLSVLMSSGEAGLLINALRPSPAWLALGPVPPEAPAPGTWATSNLFQALSSRPRPTVLPSPVAVPSADTQQLNAAAVNGGLSEEEALAEVIRRSLNELTTGSGEAAGVAAAPLQRASTEPPSDVLAQTPATVRAMHRTISLGPEVLLEAALEHMLTAGAAAEARARACVGSASAAQQAEVVAVVPWAAAAAERLAFNALLWALPSRRRKLALTAVRWGTALASAASPLHWVLDREVDAMPSATCLEFCKQLLDLSPALARMVSTPPPGRCAAAAASAASAGRQAPRRPMIQQCSDSVGSALHVALNRGRADEADLLLARGAPTSGARGQDGQTALMIACREGIEKVALALLRRRFEDKDVNARAANGATALVFAASNGMLATVDRLISCHAKVDARAESGLSPFELAVTGGHCDVALSLLRAGASIASTALPAAAAPAAPLSQATPTKLAAQQASPTRPGKAALPASDPLLVSLCDKPRMERVVLAMIKRIGPCVGPAQRAAYEPAGVSISPLHKCLEYNLLAAAAALVEAGVNLELRTHVSGHTPLLSAVQFRRHAAVPWLLAGGADPCAATASGRSALSLSLSHRGASDAETTLLLIEKGADVNVRSLESGLTPLIEVMHNNGYRANATTTTIALKLLARGAVPAAQPAVPAFESAEGHALPALPALESAFLEATSLGLDEVAEAIALLPRPATALEPLHNSFVRCIIRHCPRTAFVLLAQGADANAECDGWLPLHATASTNSVDLTAELLRRGAHVDAIDSKGLLETALHVAAKSRHADVAKLLLNAGADPNACTAAGETVLTLAASHCSELAEYLVERVAACHEAAKRLASLKEVAVPSATDMPLPPAQGGAAAPAAEAAPTTEIVRADVTEVSAAVLESTSVTLPALAPSAAVLAPVEIFADLNARRADGKTSLEVALESGRTALSEALVRAGAIFADPVNVYVNGRTKIMCRAVTHAHYRTAAAMLERGASANETLTSSGYSIAHVAAQHGFVPLLEAFVRAGGNLELRCLSGWTPLQHALINHNNACAKAMLTRLGARINVEDLEKVHLYEDTRKLVDDYKALAVACRVESGGGGEAVLTALRERASFAPAPEPPAASDSGVARISINTRNEDGRTLLLLACSAQATSPEAAAASADVVRALLTRSEIDVDACDDMGVSPLLAAAANGRADIVALLLSRRANVNARCTAAATASSSATCASAYSASTIAAGTAPSSVGVSIAAGKSALMCAAARGHVEVLDVLLADERLDANAVDVLGNSALVLATASGRLTCVEHLVACRGVDRGLTNAAGHSALELAATCGRLDIVQALLVVPTLTLPRPALGAQSAANAHEDADAGGPQDGSPAMAAAAASGAVAIMRTLLAGAAAGVVRMNVNAGGHGGEGGGSALLQASMRGHDEAVALLLEQPGVDVNAADAFDGRTALAAACVAGHVGLARKLLAAGADARHIPGANSASYASALAAGGGVAATAVEALLARLKADAARRAAPSALFAGRASRNEVLAADAVRRPVGPRGF